jgi:hypothetical protein
LDRHAIARQKYTPPWYPEQFRLRLLGIEEGQRTSLYEGSKVP